MVVGVVHDHGSPLTLKNLILHELVVFGVKPVLAAILVKLLYFRIRELVITLCFYRFSVSDGHQGVLLIDFLEVGLIISKQENLGRIVLPFQIAQGYFYFLFLLLNRFLLFFALLEQLLAFLFQLLLADVSVRAVHSGNDQLINEHHFSFVVFDGCHQFPLGVQFFDPHPLQMLDPVDHVFGN